MNDGRTFLRVDNNSAGSVVVTIHAERTIDGLVLPDLEVTVLTATDILIVNAIEAGQITGQPVTSLTEAEEAALALKTKGVAAAIVTMGAAGVAAISRDEVAVIQHGPDSRQQPARP